MHRSQQSRSFHLNDAAGFKKKMLNWVERFSIFCYLDNQQYAIEPQQTDCLVAAGAERFVSGNDLRLADAFFQYDGWAFGHLSYELKNFLHGTASFKQDEIGFPPFYFFEPQVVLEITSALLVVHAADPEQVFAQINEVTTTNRPQCPVAEPSPVLSRGEYLKIIEAVQAHIQRGDCYEINFCQEFVANEAIIHPTTVFERLMAVSPNPFSAFYRLHDKYLLCASPERFLLKQGKRLVSQPIKGTARRSFASPAEDDRLKESLRKSAKEQSENVMVVDLVRNDLTRICKEATVRVDELFGIYSFPQVHQMISTISGELRDDASFSGIMAATFPMGSMTGAPKHRVMQLIDEYEPAARGIFSGAVGYVRPGGDFDFNVVIRSLMYNETKKRLSYQVGSGITAYSNAEQEWEECMLKAEAIRQVLAENAQ